MEATLDRPAKAPSRAAPPSEERCRAALLDVQSKAFAERTRYRAIDLVTWNVAACLTYPALGERHGGRFGEALASSATSLGPAGARRVFLDDRRDALVRDRPPLATCERLARNLETPELRLRVGDEGIRRFLLGESRESKVGVSRGGSLQQAVDSLFGKSEPAPLPLPP